MSAALAFSNERVQLRLFRLLIGYEAIVVSTIAFASYTLATSRGGSPITAAPVALIAAAECLRIPLSGWLTRLTWAGKAIALVSLVVISISSFDGLALAFEQLVNARVLPVAAASLAVADAERVVERVETSRNLANDQAEKLAGEVRALDAQIAELNRTRPQQAAASTRTCVDKHARRISCASDYLSAVAAAHASEAQVALIKSLSDERAKAQGRLTEALARTAGIEDHAADDRLSAAKQRLADELSASPVHRIAAAVFSVPAIAVTDAQFQTVKKFIVFGLATAFATLSAAVSIAAHLEAKSGKSSKLARALRAALASTRKRMRRIEPTIEYRDREHTRFVYVPTDMAGRVVDPDLQR